MNYSEALLSRLDKIIEKMEVFENNMHSIDMKLQSIIDSRNTNDSYNLINSNLNSSSSTDKLGPEHTWSINADMKYKQGITPDQRRRENRQANMIRSSSPSQRSGITLRQVSSFGQNETKRSAKLSRSSSTDNNNNNTKPITSNSTLSTNISSEAKKVVPVQAQNKVKKTETPPTNKTEPIQTPPSNENKSSKTISFFPDDSDDDLQFDED